MNTPVGSQMNNPVPPKPPMPEAHSNGAGTWIAAVVIIAALVVGAFYFWNQHEGAVMDEATDTAALQSINSQSTSDETSSIEADLNATDVETIDAELNAS